MKQTNWFFLFFAAFIIYSCSPDMDIAKDEVRTAAVRQTLSANDLKRLAPKVYAAADGIQQKNKYAYARGETAGDSTYIIRTDRILEIQERGWTCYTFSIERHPESRFTENLVITVDPDGKMFGRILNYDFTAADISNIQLGNKVDLSNKVTMTEVKDIATARRSAEDCVQISIAEGPLCPSGQHDVAAMNHGDCDYVNDGSYTPGPAYVVTIIIDMSCFSSNDGGGSVGGLGNYGPGPSWGWSGGGGGLGVGGGATIGNGGGSGVGGNMGQDGTNIPLVLNPIKDINQDVPLLTSPLLLFPPETIDPCDHLKTLGDSDKGNLKPDVDELKGYVAAGQKVESGCQIEMHRDSEYDPPTYTHEFFNSGQTLSVEMQVGSDIIGHIHLHPFPKGVPIPSFIDVRALRNDYKELRRSKKNQAFEMVVVKDNTGILQTYCLLISDFTKLDQHVNSQWGAPNLANLTDQQALQKLSVQQSILFATYNGNNELGFLQEFREFGVDLYKADDDSLTHWSKLSLEELSPAVGNTPATYVVKSTPCQ